MLNELETVYWALSNSMLDIISIETDLILDYLMITALFAKKLTCGNEEIKIHESFLSHNYQMFMKNYLMWEEMKTIKAEDFSLIAVNAEFTQLFSNMNGTS